MSVSTNTKVILLLTAPLLLGGKYRDDAKILSNKEYNQFAGYLKNIGKQPLDLLTSDLDMILDGYKGLDSKRIHQLLNRGFLLSQVLDYWYSRNIWVVSRADTAYPKRLKSRLVRNAPPILYGCGDIGLLNLGGLSIVGSRNIDDELVKYVLDIAKLSAQSQTMVVSGGARGVDLSAMQGALKANGLVCGVLSDGLEKAALNADNRLAFQENKLVLISACDPKSRFSVSNAMQRNKYIYALSDVGLVVNAELNKGGTWAGAIEQLERYSQIPIYVRSTGKKSLGLDALVDKGAVWWPNPNSTTEFLNILSGSFLKKSKSNILLDNKSKDLDSMGDTMPAQKLFLFVKELIEKNLQEPKQEKELVELLGVSKSQAKLWLNRLIDEGAIIRCNKTHYILCTCGQNLELF